jgi:hypothetical protein
MGFNRHHDTEGVALYTVKLPLGLSGELHSIPLPKLRGRASKVRADEARSNFADGGEIGN